MELTIQLHTEQISQKNRLVTTMRGRMINLISEGIILIWDRNKLTSTSQCTKMSTEKIKPTKVNSFIEAELDLMNNISQLSKLYVYPN